MGGSSRDELLRLADKQHDILSREDLRRLGLGDDAIDYRVRTRQLHRHFTGVFSPSRKLTDRGRWYGAIVACGRSTALADLSAGALLEMVRGDGGGAPFVASSRELRLSGIRSRQTTLRRWEVMTVDGIAVTIPARTLVDLCADASPVRVLRLIRRAHRLRVYDHRSVLRVLETHPRIPGAARLRKGLEAYVEPQPTKNELEEAMNAICDRLRRPRPGVNVLVEGVEVDFLWPRVRLIVETDGRDTHLTPQAFEEDRARDAWLTTLGYRVVRFTYRQVIDDPDKVARILLALLSCRDRL